MNVGSLGTTLTFDDLVRTQRDKRGIQPTAWSA